MKPYIDDKIDVTSWIRTFDPAATDSHEYIWHMDKKNRSIQVLEGEGWQFQMDNELPISINRYSKFEIPKMVYHRIIPGETQLRIIISEDV